MRSPHRRRAALFPLLLLPEVSRRSGDGVTATDGENSDEFLSPSQQNDEIEDNKGEYPSEARVLRNRESESDIPKLAMRKCGGGTGPAVPDYVVQDEGLK